MGKYLKKFETDSVRVEYEDSERYIEPYVSYVEGDNTVHYNKPKETRVVAVFNVTSTSEPTPIGYYGRISEFAEIEIDGVVQPSVVSAYTFDTIGEHTVKYTLKDPTSIGYDIFNNCWNLTSVTIPDSVTSIGDDAFQFCRGLTSVTIPNSVTSIGRYAFQECYSLTNLTIPNGVTSIGSSALRKCSGLTEVAIPSGVTSIDEYVFQYCYGLTEVTIPNSVTSIGNRTFDTCSGLTSVTIGNGITSIGNQAFINCSKLKSVTVEAITPPTLGSAAFFGLPITYGIYVPSESVETYKAASGWSDYASSIQPIPTT